MLKQLPTRPHIDHLKREAKSLGLPHAEALHQIAVSYGFPSWPKLKSRVEEINLARLDPTTWLRRVDMPKPVNPHPNPDKNFWITIANGDAETLKEQITTTNANSPGGPLNRHPIHYATTLCVHSIDLPATLRLLLESGANPNLKYEHPNYEGSSLTALWGAIQIKQDVVATQILLEAGANPNDNESLYHACELEDPKFLELLLTYGAEENGTNALARSLDFERLAQVELLLKSGADPNRKLGQENMIHHAIRRGRSKPFVDLLLTYGADPTGLSNEQLTAVNHAAYRSPYDLFESLNPETATPEAHFVARIRNGEPAALPAKLSPLALSCLCHATFNSLNQEARKLLEAGWPVDAPDNGSVTGSHGATPLLCACFVGNSDLAKLFIERGADINYQEPTYKSTPLGWALYGSIHSQMPGHDHRECARLLIEAGCNKPTSVETATDELRDLLAEYNYLPNDPPD